MHDAIPLPALNPLAASGKLDRQSDSIVKREIPSDGSSSRRDPPNDFTFYLPTLPSRIYFDLIFIASSATHSHSHQPNLHTPIGKDPQPSSRRDANDTIRRKIRSTTFRRYSPVFPRSTNKTNSTTEIRTFRLENCTHQMSTIFEIYLIIFR